MKLFQPLLHCGAVLELHSGAVELHSTNCEEKSTSRGERGSRPAKRRAFKSLHFTTAPLKWGGAKQGTNEVFFLPKRLFFCLKAKESGGRPTFTFTFYGLELAPQVVFVKSQIGVISSSVVPRWRCLHKRPVNFRISSNCHRRFLLYLYFSHSFSLNPFHFSIFFSWCSLIASLTEFNVFSVVFVKSGHQCICGRSIFSLIHSLADSFSSFSGFFVCFAHIISVSWMFRGNLALLLEAPPYC